MHQRKHGWNKLTNLRRPQDAPARSRRPSKGQCNGSRSVEEFGSRNPASNGTHNSVLAAEPSSSIRQLGIEEEELWQNLHDESSPGKLLLDHEMKGSDGGGQMWEGGMGKLDKLHYCSGKDFAWPHVTTLHERCSIVCLLIICYNKQRVKYFIMTTKFSQKLR